MEPKTYYEIATIVAALGILGACVGYLVHLNNTITAISVKVDLMLTNHLPHLYDSVHRIENILFKREPDAH